MSNMLMKTPASIDELVMCLKVSDNKTYILAGGTDLIIKLRTNNIYEGTLIDLTGINALKQINHDNEYINIGAAATFSQIAEHHMLRKHCKCLVQASRQIGSTQIRNMATLGGNVANAFAGADAIPALMVLNAKITVLKPDGSTYTKSIDEIITGSRKNSLEYNEAIINISIPIPTEDHTSAFVKLGSRRKVTISKLNMAAMVKINNEAAKIEAISIVLGALGTKAFYSEAVQRALINERITEALYKSFESELVKQVEAAIPGRSSMGYKREAIKGLAHDIFLELFSGMIGKVKNND